MRVMVALEDRFFRTQNGNIYSNTIYDYHFWKRYLQVFDEVVVLARVCELDQEKLDKPQANGSCVSFFRLPYYVGPYQYLRKYYKLNRSMKNVLLEADAFILRIPGIVSTLLWHRLQKRKIPYGVEIVGDPYDSLAPGSVKSILRPAIRYKARKDMERQCRQANAASYVTEYSLQKRYPSDCWSTHYSSIDLPDSDFINELDLEKRIARIKAKAENREPWHICHVGMMEHLYKAQDILLNAIAICRKKSIEIELSFIGDGRYKARLQQQTEKLGLVDKVRFLGKLDSGNPVYRVLDHADLYVLPSRQEGLPRTIIEAMARGLPCISSTVGGIPELLESKYLVAPGEDRILAQKIERVLNNPEEMAGMSKQNVLTARKYHSKELNKRRVEFYRELVDQSHLHL